MICWRSLRSVSSSSRSCSVSPTQRIGVSPASSAAGTFSASARSVSPNSSRRSECPSTTPCTPTSRSIGGEISPGEGALGLVVHVLRVDLHARAARAVDHRAQVGERHADRDVDAVDRGDARQQRLDVVLGLAARSCTSSSCPRSAACAVPLTRPRPRLPERCTPGSARPSTSSSVAPPPVERWSTASSRPKCASAAAESPPPTTVTPGAAATASATARVPAANGSSSNAPIGPFQKTEPARAISSA